MAAAITTSPVSRSVSSKRDADSCRAKILRLAISCSGLASSGVHSNGYSARAQNRRAGESLSSDGASAPFDTGRKLGETLLQPTRIYVKAALQAIKTGHVKAMAHITGGGLLENIPRILPGGLGVVRLNAKSWTAPPVFRWLAQKGNIDPVEMARTFNCGIGLVVVAAPQYAEDVTKALADAGEKVFRMGAVEAGGTERVVLEGMDTVWPC